MMRRLLLTYLTFALLILVSLEVPLGYVYHRSEQQRAFAQLEHDAEVLAAFVDTAISEGEPGQTGLLAQESAQRWGGHVDIVDGHGRVLFTTYPGGRPPGGPDPAADIRTALDGHGRISTRTGQSAGEQVMSVAVPIHPGKPAQGALRVSVPMAPLTSRVHQFWWMLAAVGVIVLAAVALVAVALARWISRPVRALERATRRLAEGNLPPPESTRAGPPEVRSLAATFYTTAHRLQQLLASQRSFIGHASHQLKTPLAALRLRLENLEPDISPAGGANLRSALAETDRLARLVDALLAMTRSEQTALPAEPVTLAVAVGERLLHWTPLAANGNVRLGVSGPDDARVRAIPGAVEQILDNLLSNALNVAPRGSTVTVNWRRTETSDPAAATIELHVVDEGPGLPAEQRQQAMEPFWRAPGAAKGGTGLGLALVRSLVQASGGRVRLDEAGGHGIDAVLTLPSAPALADTATAQSASNLLPVR